MEKQWPLIDRFKTIDKNGSKYNRNIHHHLFACTKKERELEKEVSKSFEK